MWNSNKRRWLVKVRRRKAITTTRSQIPFINYICTKTLREKLIPVSWKFINCTTTTSNKKAWPKKSLTQVKIKLCLNQIIEVLLAILLANCLGIAAQAVNIDPEMAWANLLRQQRHSLNSPEAQMLLQQRSLNYKISPKPCSIGGIDGTCMFVWECIKSEGRHVGMCVDSFMFGSCCVHNYTDNIVLPQAFYYTRPTKPFHGPSNQQNRPRPPPPHQPARPGHSGMTTIERPHGAGTLVIRPSGPHHQGALQRPHTTTTTITTTTTTSTSSSANAAIAATTTRRPPDMQTQSASFSASVVSVSSLTNWHSKPTAITTSTALQHWHMTTAPSFITKPRPPPSWQQHTQPSTTLLLPIRPKPTKPNKITTTTTSKQTTTTTTQKTTTNKPRPQPSSPTIRPPTPVWFTSESVYDNSNKTTTTTTLKTTTSVAATTISTTTFKPSYKPISTALPTQNYSHIETNEIVDTTLADGTIKLMSAARSECGIPTLARPETRIVGGKTSVFGHWPWQVSVRRTTFFGFSSTHRCGGALINENWIATAGHCVDDLLISQIRIRVGEYDFSHVQEQLQYIERGVVKKVVHPKYNFYTYEYDLALVKLETPLDFAPHISPICLPQTDSLLIGMNATVTGWGRLSEGGTLPSVLQEASVPIVSNDNCKSMFLRAGRLEFIPEIFLCAGYETGGQDSCQGDSGGPLQVKAQDGRYFLAGIISWGIGCAEANLPGVCTRISKFVPWIMENVT